MHHYMVNQRDNLPLDTRLLSEAIIELNISRHNVSIYPRNHPVVEKSLNQVYGYLQKLFELRKEVTLAIAKDTLIIDTYFLDKQNPVYKDFARCLNRKNIASVKFISGLTKDELYSFHHFISKNVQDVSSREIEDLFREYNILYIKIEFVDFSAFNLLEGKTDQAHKEVSLWEKYVFGLLEGRLQTEDAQDMIQKIPPHQLAGLVNKTAIDKIKEESYDRVITSYLRKSSERAFSTEELKKVLDFINALRPELKRHFLSSAVGAFSRDLDSVKRSLEDMSADTVIDLLSIINEQMVALPEPIKNILDKFSRLRQGNFEAPHYREGLIEDDILLSPEITNLLSNDSYKAFVSDSYQQEIQSLIKFDAKGINIEGIKEFEKEWSDEHIEKVFHQIILELTFSDMPDIVTKEEYEFFINMLKEQIEQFIQTGQYERVLYTFRIIESNSAMNRFPELSSNIMEHCHSPEFISLLISSFRIMGIEKKKDALRFCEYYGEKIIPPLMDTLGEEESRSIRKLIISLIIHFGEKIIPEVIKRLDDGRWFVTRNMLFLLNECGDGDVLQNARSYCEHENPRVSFEAIKCLLKAKDSYGFKSLKDHLRSESRDIVTRAIALSGAFKVNEVVPDLIQMLKKKTITGLDEEKIHIVKALGQIGDIRALEPIRNILSTKTLLFKGGLEKLKDEIYRTLNNYPYEEVRDLIEKSKK